uniref:Uncharacterized protein n=1 Tax=Anguilla anguilla TaxID=7936 RepID=A0A0E9RLS8_ANGAN
MCTSHFDLKLFVKTFPRTFRSFIFFLSYPCLSMSASLGKSH